MSEPKVLAFDLFGTLFDWRGSLAEEGWRRGNYLRPQPDWDAFAVAWSKGYASEVASMTEWTKLDELLEQAFKKLVPEFGFGQLCNMDYSLLSTAWTRLKPWPDVTSGLQRLSREYELAALTNANYTMIAALAKDLPFDSYCSAEDSKCYKPCPEIYLAALKALGSPRPDEVVMVAAHTFDLNAASKLGFRTALIEREGEPGSSRTGLDHEAGWIVRDIEALATALT